MVANLYSQFYLLQLMLLKAVSKTLRRADALSDRLAARNWLGAQELSERSAVKRVLLTPQFLQEILESACAGARLAVGFQQYCFIQTVILKAVCWFDKQ